MKIKVRIYRNHKMEWKYIDEFLSVEVKGLLFRHIYFLYSGTRYKKPLKYNEYGYYFEFQNANYYVEEVK